ncbi:hypothetical protein Goshw_029158, partial [Gossypium schwendimanii]|nr:hypothetical protein [Gossypium schwendimanii]
GVYDGLKVAWKLGARKVLLEVDNLAAVKVLGGCSGDETELNVVCRSIKEMLKRNWEVQVHHTDWEGNALAVVMANIAFSNPFGVQIYNEEPVEVSDVGRCDRDGLRRPKMIMDWCSDCFSLEMKGDPDVVMDSIPTTGKPLSWKDCLLGTGLRADEQTEAIIILIVKETLSCWKLTSYVHRLMGSHQFTFLSR